MKSRRLGELIGVAAGITALLVVGYSAIGPDEANPVDETLQGISNTRFLLPLVVTAIGIVAVAFLAGRRRPLVVVAALGLLVVLNITTDHTFTALTRYPTHPGTERESLEELAQASPNANIVRELPTVMALGERLGSARLAMSFDGLGARIRAFTEIDVVDVTTARFRAPGGETYPDAAPLGQIGDFQVSLLTGGASYVWLVLDDGRAVIVPEGMAIDTGTP